MLILYISDKEDQIQNTAETENKIRKEDHKNVGTAAKDITTGDIKEESTENDKDEDNDNDTGDSISNQNENGNKLANK